MQTTIIWPDPTLAAAIPLTSEFSPVFAWDSTNNRRTDVQQTDDHGLPIWEADALLKMGWDPHVTPVRVRVPLAHRPTVHPNSARLASMLGVANQQKDEN